MPSLMLPSGQVVQWPDSMAQPTAPAFGNPSFSSVLAQPEDIWQPQYDRANYAAAGAFQVFFFTVPQGTGATLITGGASATKIKSARDTSLTQQGVSPTKAFDFRGISVQFVPVQQAVAAANTVSIADDKARLYFGGFVQFQIVDKPRLFLPLALFRNLDPDVGSTTINASTVWGAGSVGTGIYPIDPIVIPANTNWSVFCQFDGSPVVTQTFDILLTLHGYVRRPQQ